MKKSQQVIRFTVKVTTNTSFMLEINAEDFLSCDVETEAREAAKHLQSLGYFKNEDINLDDEMFFHDKIIFSSKVWL